MKRAAWKTGYLYFAAAVFFVSQILMQQNTSKQIALLQSQNRYLMTVYIEQSRELEALRRERLAAHR